MAVFVTTTNGATRTTFRQCAISSMATPLEEIAFAVGTITSAMRKCVLTLDLTCAKSHAGQVERRVSRLPTTKRRLASADF